MSPRDKDRRKISGRVIGAAAAGAGVLLISIGALISNIGSGSDTPSPGAGVVRLELIAARDIGALSDRDTWCSGAAHCWVMQQASGNATDLGSPGGWHLVPTDSPRAGVVNSLPVRDASNWVDYTTERGAWSDTAGYYLGSSLASPDASELSITVVFNAALTGVNQRLFTHQNGATTSAPDFYLNTTGKLVALVKGATASKTVTSAGTYADGAWHCATFSSDGTGSGGYLWVDLAVDKTGQDVATGSLLTTATPVVMASPAGATPLTGSAARVRLKYATSTIADHQALCGDLWQAPAGGRSDNKPYASDDTWTQTAGAGCYPTGDDTAVCVPGGLMPYTVDATGIGWPVQQAITNPVLYSTAMDCTNWTCVGATSATYGKVAPDGSATATEITVALGANHFEQDISAGYTASASPLHLGMWLDCSSGLIHPHGSNDGARGDWDVSCSCIGGQWTYIHADHPCVTVQIPFNADGSGDSGIHYDGTVVVDATVWAPTLTEQRAWSRVVIPTAAAGVSLGDPIWAINNGLGNKQPQLVNDGDMEASGTSAWQCTGTGCALSKETGSPHGGAQSLRVTGPGGSSVSAQQAAASIGDLNRLMGWATSDGTVLPRILDGAVALWTGTNSTSWQPFDVSYTATSTTVRFFAISPNGGYVEWDDITMYEQEPFGNYYRAGDTVTQDLTEYDGTCFAVPGTDILLAGSPTCSGSWYGLKVQK